MTMFVILVVRRSWNRGDGLRLGIYGMINVNINCVVSEIKEFYLTFSHSDNIDIT